MTQEQWGKTIEPRNRLLRLNLLELWWYRDLIFSFVKRDFVSLYKQTLLGPIWYLIQPLASSVIIYVVFNTIAKIPTGNIPPFLFYLSGNLLWIYFSENILKTSETFIQNANIFGKVYFPRLTVPISTTISGLISLAIHFSLFAFFYGHFVLTRNYQIHVANLIWLPAVIFHLMINSFSIGVIISALTTKYRDLRFTLRFGIQLWMFASPIAYSTAQVPPRYLDWYLLNPVSVTIEGFRFAFFGESVLTIQHVTISTTLSLLLFFLAVLLFNRIEKTFMDSV